MSHARADRTAVGVIGTGTMGAAMVRRLLEADHAVVVHDARPEAMGPLVDSGAVPASNVGGVAARCRVVLTSLPGPTEVEAVAEQLVAASEPGDVHVGHSTVSVDAARRLGAQAEAAGRAFLDAPVSGGPMGVAAGTLAILASGPSAALDAARPFLSAYAGRIFDLGDTPGAGTLAKLVNNAIFLCSGLVHQEAVVLAAKAGMDPAVLDEVLAAGSASLFLGLAGPTLSRRWDDTGFSVALAEKDVALALESARSLAVPMPVTAAAHQHYLRARATGLADKVCFATLAVVEVAAGVDVPARSPSPPTTSGRPSVNRARAAGERYVACVNAGDLDALVDLFTPDAVVLHPIGAFEGIDAVRGFYADNILPHRPALTATGWVVEDDRCAFELEALTAGRTSYALDHCTVDGEGRIRRMAIAYR